MVPVYSANHAFVVFVTLFSCLLVFNVFFFNISVFELINIFFIILIIVLIVIYFKGKDYFKKIKW